MKTILNTAIAVTLIGTIFTSCKKEEGCTDPAATNFNVEAIPMYNLREEALKFHPKGRGNGYVLHMG